MFIHIGHIEAGTRYNNGKKKCKLLGSWSSGKVALLTGTTLSAGGLSAVNAIGTQLRDPINSGLTRWRV